MKINAAGMDFQQLNRKIRESADRRIRITGCCGQRYIASGLSGREVTIEGVPGNALGAYLDGAELYVRGNVQDAAGDTMNAGTICVDGMAGDAAGYAMRGGSILIHGDAGYRAGIHMKEYQEKKPLIIIGGSAGSFLGEYQAGGTIIVLGLHCEGKPPVGNFCGVGMHGGKMYLRADHLPDDLSDRLVHRVAGLEDLQEIEPELRRFCELFDEPMQRLWDKPFYLITPNSQNPYQQLYTAN